MKNCYFPHTGDISTEHLPSLLVANVIKAVKAVTAFLAVHYLATATIPNVTKRLLCKIELPAREYLVAVVVIPRSVDNSGTIEVHVRYH